MDLVTLDEASAHLRRDTTADDADLRLKISAASNAVFDYLKDTPPWLPERDDDGVIVRDSAGNVVYAEDSAGVRIVDPRVKAATLMLIDEFYNSRGGEQRGVIDARFGYGYLPRGVTATLYSLRLPTLG